MLPLSVHLSVSTETSHKVGALLHNLIGGSQQMTQKATMPPRPQNRLGFQEPKRYKLQRVTQTKSFEENSNRCTKCKWQEHHKGVQILLSQIPPKLQKLLGE